MQMEKCQVGTQNYTMTKRQDGKIAELRDVRKGGLNTENRIANCLDSRKVS
jgi:hypothetical protein